MNFSELCKERYAVRAYKDAPVEEAKLAAILEAAKVAPTACNNQPQKIYVVKSEEKRRALAEITPCTFGAPVVFVVGFDVTRSAKGLVYEGHDFGDTDAAIVCTHMMLEAWEQGLGSCWVGYFNEEKVKAALGLPETVRVRDLLPVGYAADNAVPAPLHSKFRDMADMVEVL